MRTSSRWVIRRSLCYFAPLAAKTAAMRLCCRPCQAARNWAFPLCGRSACSTVVEMRLAASDTYLAISPTEHLCLSHHILCLGCSPQRTQSFRLVGQSLPRLTAVFAPPAPALLAPRRSGPIPLSARASWARSPHHPSQGASARSNACADSGIALEPVERISSVDPCIGNVGSSESARSQAASPST